jgi:tetratricopeptide (TPR) repeat protein
MFERFQFFARRRLHKRSAVFPEQLDDGAGRNSTQPDTELGQILAHADRARDERRWANGRDFYAEYLALQPDNAPIWVQYGHCLKESGDLDTAENAYRRSLALAPQVADTHLQLGHLFKVRGSKARALAAYRRALELDPSMPDASKELDAILAERTGRMAPRPAAAAASPPIRIDELNRAADAFLASNGRPEGTWLEFSGRRLSLPSWFDFSMDPRKPAYREQQISLWMEISGISGDYRPSHHELSGSLDHFDPIRRPGFYAARDKGAVTAASDQLIALGQILKHSGVGPGDWVLEYGAGFGQIALALARLGVSVDTVDIEPTFCAAVTTQSEFFSVSLTAFEGNFGLNPRGDYKYNLILFYESFHHCLDFLTLIPRLRSYPAPGGRIILAGEPIVSADDKVVPYPWGIRLDAECVAIVRLRGWFELGFHEGFLVSQFIRSGFVWQAYPGQISHVANLHVFKRRPDIIELETYQLPEPDASGWHSPQPGGRFTREVAYLPIDTSGDYAGVVLRLYNHHHRPIEVSVRCGTFAETKIYAGAGVVEIPATAIEGRLCVTAETICPETYGHPDGRLLGIFVEKLEYVPDTTSAPRRGIRENPTDDAVAILDVEWIKVLAQGSADLRHRGRVGG